MSHSKPTLSVGMPVYNGSQYIESAVEAVLNQTFEDFELIICDNASTDETEEICRALAQQDKRIAYHRNPTNIGAAANYNRLVDLATADYFRWSNADDLIAPTLHQRCLDVLEANPDAVLSYGKTQIIDFEGVEGEIYEDNLDLQQEQPSDRFAKFHDCVGLTNIIYGLMRTAAVRNTAQMGNGSYPAADTNFMGELVLYGKFIEIPETLFYRRMHPGSSTANRGEEETAYFWSAGGAFTFPTWKKNLAYVDGIRKAPIDFSNKKRLTGYMLKRFYAAKRECFAELVGEIGTRVGLTRPNSG